MYETKTNFFAIPFLTFIPTKYRQLVREGGGKIFASILIWFLILNVAWSIPGFTAIDELVAETRENCPEFDISNGRLTMPVPFELKEDGLCVQIDDSIEKITPGMIENVRKIAYYDTVLLVGGDSVGVYSQGQYQTFEYSDMPGFSLSKDSLCDHWLPMIKPIIVVVMILAALFSIGFYYLAALIIQFLTGVLGKAYHTKLGFSERFKLTVLAKFPPYVVFFLIGKLLTSIIPPFRLGFQIFYILIVLLFYSKENPDPMQPQIEERGYE